MARRAAITSVPSRAAATKALRRLARKGPPLYTSLEAPLRRAVILYWESMDGARKALGLRKPPPPRQAWTRERVIAEIRKLHRSGQHMSTTAVTAAGRNDLVIAAMTYAGGWARARDVAGVKFNARRAFTMPVWDAATVVAEIQARRREGLPLAISKAPKSLTCAACRIFGSWRAAITAAGIDYNSVLLLRQHNDHELLAWLRKLARTNPHMSLYDLDKYGQHTVACRRRWGSLEAAARAAGLNDWPIRIRAPAMSRLAVVRTLRKWQKNALPLQLSAVRAIEGGHHLINSVFHYFKTWSAALEALSRRT
jgi:hypothetical protein